MRGASRSLLDRPAPESVRKVALGCLDAASRARDGLENGSDGEALHDFRVAIRRLRTTFRVYRPVLAGTIRGRHRRALRALMRATGTGRDAEVQLQWLESVVQSLPEDERDVAVRLTDALRAEKAEGYGLAAAAIHDDFRQIARRVRKRLCTNGSTDGSEPARTRSFAAVVDRILPEIAAELGDALDAVETTEDREEAHAARIRGKRLRYVLEPLSAEVQGVNVLVDRLKSLQDALGDLRDMQLVESRIQGLGAGVPGAERLRALARDVQKVRFELFRQEWKGPAVETFFADLQAVCHRIGKAAPDAVEIERKYLLSERPDGIETASVREIRQGYLPGHEIQERLRRVREGESVRYVRSIKLGSGIARTEVQEEIDEGLFESLWPFTEGRRLSKRRHRIFTGGLVWEVDEFTSRDLWLAEVEIPSADFEPELPDWLAPFVVREVTEEPEYLNVNLAE